MPKGTMMWFDSRTGVGRIAASGREYPVAGGEVEAHAGVAGAPVHFDVVRVEGVPTAVRITARPGTRTTRRQRRFGDQTGAGRREEKGRPPLTRRSPSGAAGHACRFRIAHGQIVEQWDEPPVAPPDERG